MCKQNTACNEIIVEASGSIYVSGHCTDCRERGLIGNRSRKCPQCEDGYQIVIPVCASCYEDYQELAVCEVCGDVTAFPTYGDEPDAIVLCPTCMVKGEMTAYGLVFGTCTECGNETVLTGEEHICENCMLKTFMDSFVGDGYTYCTTCQKPIERGDKCIYHLGEMILSHE